MLTDFVLFSTGQAEMSLNTKFKEHVRGTENDIIQQWQHIQKYRQQYGEMGNKVDVVRHPKMGAANDHQRIFLHIHT
jgi:hypothetical protein